MPEQHLSLIFNPSRAVGIVLYDLASAGTSDPPLWNTPGERLAWPPPEHGREGEQRWISERKHELEIAVLVDGLVALKIETSPESLAPPPGEWDVRLMTTLICPSKALGFRNITGKAQAVLAVCDDRLTIAVSGRFLEGEEEESDAIQEFVIQIWPELGLELIAVPKQEN